MAQNHTDKYTGRGVADAASHYGLYLGGMWTASFLCSMYSMKIPMLGIVGNTLALLSVYALYLFVVRYRTFVAPLRFGGCFSLAWLTCVFACLITTLAQYLYFRYLDGGQLLASLSALLHDTQYRQMMEQMMPGMKPDDMLAMLKHVSVGDMTLQLWGFNIFLSFPLAFIAAIFGSMKNISRIQEKL